MSHTTQWWNAVCGQVFVFVLFPLLLLSPSALALDKQGSAHGGAVGEESRDFNVSGAAMLGVSLYNPSYAARPDNTGLAALRYGGHLDVDVLGRLLSVPLDVSFFTDAMAPGARVLTPSEFDFIGGLSSTFAVGPGDLELSTHVEHDRPVDKAGFTQTYVDARARYLYSMARLAHALREALHQGDISGWVTLGGFLFNPTYAARPDNTGLALLRYALHGELSVFDDLVSLGLDGTMFTDRRVHALRPSELDLTVDLIFHWKAFEVHLAYERDMPVDSVGVVQQFVYMLGAWSFDLHGATQALTHKTPVPSP